MSFGGGMKTEEGERLKYESRYPLHLALKTKRHETSLHRVHHTKYHCTKCANLFQSYAQIMNITSFLERELEMYTRCG